MLEPLFAATVLGAIAGLATFAALRDLVAETPGLMRWLFRVLEPLARAGREGYLPTRPETRRLALAAAASVVVSGWLLFGPVAALPVCLAAPFASRWLVGRRRARYRQRLDASIPEAAGAIADALAAGRSLRAALSELAEGLGGSAAAEFAVLGAELDLGTSTGAAIEGLRRRHPSPRTESFCSALLAGRGSGADLAALMRRFAAAALAKDRADRDARSATAQARFTGLLVAAMPAGAAVFAELVQGGLVASVLRSPLALTLVCVAVGMQLVGFVAIRRLAGAPR